MNNAAQIDDEAVDRFATAMKAKLAKAREKGRNGWQSPEWTAPEISLDLLRHVEKGDPIDVANYCMFLFERGERIFFEKVIDVAFEEGRGK
jgi:hypothetical protein